jgi:coenzyme PQQ precursor peptide PqqA
VLDADALSLIRLASGGLGELLQDASRLRQRGAAITTSPGDQKMKWNTPKVIEVSVGMEINMYACATRRMVKGN